MKHRLNFAGIAAVSVLAFVTVSCNSDSDSAKAASSAPDVVVGAAGSTFVAPLMTAWIDGYHHTHPKNVINYQAIGSGGGLDEFKKGWPGFAATEAPLSDDQM